MQMSRRKISHGHNVRGLLSKLFEHVLFFSQTLHKSGNRLCEFACNHCGEREPDDPYPVHAVERYDMECGADSRNEHHSQHHRHNGNDGPPQGFVGEHSASNPLEVLVETL